MQPELPRRPDLRADGSPIGSDLVPGPAPVTLPDGRPKVTWRFPEVLIAYLVTNIIVAQGLVGTIIVAAFGIELSSGAADGPVLALAIATNVVGVIGLVLWLQWRHPGWREAIRFLPKMHRVREFALAYVVGLGLYPVIALGVAIIISLTIRLVAGRSVEAPEQISSDLGSGWKVVAAVVALIVAPLAEEFFFRGILFRSIRDRRGFWPGAIVSSVLFGMVHYVAAPWPDALFLQSVMVFTGLGLCAIYEWRHHLLASVAAHMAFNSIGILLIFVVS